MRYFVTWHKSMYIIINWIKYHSGDVLLYFPYLVTLKVLCYGAAQDFWLWAIKQIHTKFWSYRIFFQLFCFGYLNNPWSTKIFSSFVVMSHQRTDKKSKSCYWSCENTSWLHAFANCVNFKLSSDSSIFFAIYETIYVKRMRTVWLPTKTKV